MNRSEPLFIVKLGVSSLIVTLGTARLYRVSGAAIQPRTRWITFAETCRMLTGWKNDPDTAWPYEVPNAALQHATPPSPPPSAPCAFPPRRATQPAEPPPPRWSGARGWRWRIHGCSNHRKYAIAGTGIQLRAAICQTPVALCGHATSIRRRPGATGAYAACPVRRDRASPGEAVMASGHPAQPPSMCWSRSKSGARAPHSSGCSEAHECRRRSGLRDGSGLPHRAAPSQTPYGG